MDVTKVHFFDNAKKYGYEEFLYETWSCYHPLSNNTECGKCELCEKRIIETRLILPKILI